MSDRDALLAAVVAEPNSDLPRLVFADWCDDHGEPARSEFIRVQIAIAGLPRLVCDRDPGFAFAEDAGTRGVGAAWRVRCRCNPCTLHRLQRWPLVNGPGTDWLRDALSPLFAQYASAVRLSGLQPSQLAREVNGWSWLFQRNLVTFRRGFVEAVRLPLIDWLTDGAGLVRRNPLTEVMAIGREPNLTPASGLWTFAEGDDWWWRSWWLPAGVFRRLPGGVRPPESSAVNRYYESASDATAALSHALLDHARRLAE